MLVWPAAILRNPLARSVSMPCSIAVRRSSSVEAPTRIISRSSLVTDITSYNPIRPL